MRPGQDYPEEIIRGIELSKCLVLILSHNANASKFVRAEVERAYSKGKPVFPVRIEEVLPSRGLELFISTKHWIDAWEGNLSDHAARLVQELAQDTELDIDLPPALRRRFPIRKLMQVGGLVAVAAGIAVIVALLMRPETPTKTPSPTMATEPPRVFFMGSMVRDDMPLEASYMLTDGFDTKGAVYGVFEGVDAFEVFEVAEGVPPARLYAADPAKFKGQYQSTQTYRFPLDGLPKKVVACLQYEIAATGRREALLQAFNFVKPHSSFATFPTGEAAARRAVAYRSGTGCDALVADYAKSELKIAVGATRPR